MRKAFIVCGPESSGNRLVAAILVRAGCWGEGSTNQPKTIDEIPQDSTNIVWIKHHQLEGAVKDLRDIGFDDITLIIVVREPEANCRSMVKNGHLTSIDQAYGERLRTIQAALNTGFTFDCKIEIITYEGLSTAMLKLWLPRLGLPIDNLDTPLQLIGQHAPSIISNENAKHY